MTTGTGTRLSPALPAAVAVVLGAVAASLLLAAWPQSAFVAALALAAAVIVHQDLTRYRIPLWSLAAVAVLGVAARLAEAQAQGLNAASAAVSALAGAAAVAGAVLLFAWAYRALRGRTGLAEGDLALIAAAALWLDPWQMPLLLASASLAALAAIALRSRRRRRPLRAAGFVPFGAFLAPALWGLVIADSLGRLP